MTCGNLNSHADPGVDADGFVEELQDLRALYPR